MLELKESLNQFYPEEEVNNILRDIENLPPEEQKKEIELTLDFLKHYGGEIPSII